MVIVVGDGSVNLCSTGPTTRTLTALLAATAATQKREKRSQEHPAGCSQIPGINECTAVCGAKMEEQTLGAAGLRQVLRQDCDGYGMENGRSDPQQV